MAILADACMNEVRCEATMMPVKVTMQGCEAVRRFSITSFEDLQERLRNVLEVDEAALPWITYTDEDGDECVLSSPEEFDAAMGVCGDVLRISVTDPGARAKERHMAKCGHAGQGPWRGKGKGKGMMLMMKGKGCLAWGKGCYSPVLCVSPEISEKLEAASGRSLTARQMLRALKRARGDVEAAAESLAAEGIASARAAGAAAGEEAVKDVEGEFPTEPSCLFGFGKGCKGKGKGRQCKGKGKGKGKGFPGAECPMPDEEIVRRLEAAAGRALCERKVARLMMRVGWIVEKAEMWLAKRRESRAAREAVKEGAAESVAKLRETFPDVSEQRAQFALARAGGDVAAAGERLAQRAERISRLEALKTRIVEAGMEVPPRWVLAHDLRAAGGDVETAVAVVLSGPRMLHGKGKGKGKGCLMHFGMGKGGHKGMRMHKGKGFWMPPPFCTGSEMLPPPFCPGPEEEAFSAPLPFSPFSAEAEMLPPPMHAFDNLDAESASESEESESEQSESESTSGSKTSSHSESEPAM